MILKSYETEKIKSHLIQNQMFLFYGENYGLKKDIRKLIKIEISKDKSELETVSLFEDDILKNKEKFYNLIFSGSLFSNKKIITIYNASDKILTCIDDIVEKFPKDIFLIIFADILDKKSKLRNLFEKNDKTICIPCYQDNEKGLEIIAINELKNEKISISKESINLIIRKSEGDRNNLRNELEKIKSFSKNKKEVSLEQIKKLTNSSNEIKTDQLINVCLCGEVIELNKILEHLSVENLNQIMLIKLLGNKVRRLLNLVKEKKENQSIDAFISTVKPPIFWKEKPLVKKQLDIWNLIELKKIIYELNNIEVSCKQNPQISSIIFFNYFINLCKKASVYS
jgi:DNA polymerase-3 subunit delta